MCVSQSEAGIMCVSQSEASIMCVSQSEASYLGVCVTLDVQEWDPGHALLGHLHMESRIRNFEDNYLRNHDDYCRFTLYLMQSVVLNKVGETHLGVA